MWVDEFGEEFVVNGKLNIEDYSCLSMLINYIYGFFFF